MKTPHSTQFKSTKGINWRVKVVLHPSQRSLDRAYGPDKTLPDDMYIKAFCEEGEHPNLCVLHFTKRSFVPEIIVHESFHAVVALMKKSKLSVESESAEELLAETIENIVRECLKFRQALSFPEAGRTSRLP